MEYQRNYLPPEWNNEERIRVLMGPLPPAQDTVATKARLTFWVAAIHQWCSVTNKLTFNLQECLSAFRRGTQQPLCLPESLVHMNRLGEAIPLDELPLGEKNQESWISWGQRVFVFTPSHFAWKKFKDIIGANNLQERVFVNTAVLKTMCENVLKAYRELLAGEDHLKSAPLSLASLYHKVGHCVGSADNLHLVVESLAYNGRATTVIHKETTYVKFAMPGDIQKPVITQMELAEEDLLFAQRFLKSNILRLNTDISSLLTDIKAALKVKAKAKAMSLLRQKKRSEKSLETQMKAHENVSSCLMQLQEAQINKEVLHSFRIALEALRTAMTKDHSTDSVANTMDDLQQVLEECQDISSLLASGVGMQAADNGDDDDLMEELDQLIFKDTTNSIDPYLTNRMSGLDLPEVPRTNPLASLRDSSKPMLSPP